MPGELVKGHLDSLLLATLEREPLHGYAIIQQLREHSGGTFDLPEGTIYPALHRLEQVGLLESAWSAETGRRRRIYRLSRSGHTALASMRVEWRDFSRSVSAVLGAMA